MSSSRATPTLIVLVILALSGCSDSDSPTSPPAVEQGIWRVPGEVATIAAAADSAQPGELILVAPGLYQEHGIFLDVGVDLRGESGKAGDVIIDGQGLGRVLTAQRDEDTIPDPGDTTTVISDLVITGGAADEQGGGGLLLRLSAEISNVRFVGNTAVGPGGGAYAAFVAVRFSHCDFDSNATTSVGSGGGGLAISGGTALGVADLESDLAYCTFSGNTAKGAGGGAFVELGNLRVSHCEFSDNDITERGYHGGGGLAYHGTQNNQAIVDTCTFSENSSVDTGGGIAAVGPLDLIDCTVTGNTAIEGGGGMTGGNSIVDCLFADNSATGDFLPGLGGALWLSSSELELANCEFRGNTADEGAALFGSFGGTVTDCLFTGNDAASGGGVYATGSNTVFARCSFTNNQAAAGAGFNMTGNGLAEFIACTFFDNSVSERGGAGVVADGGTVRLTGCIVSENTSAWAGGAFATGQAIYGGSNLTLVDCTITRNTAESLGGALGVLPMDDSSPTLVRVIDSYIHNNTAPTWPGAYVSSLGAATFTCCDMVPADTGGEGTVTFVNEGCAP